MPAAAVIPAPIAYIKVVAVKKLVVEVWTHSGLVHLTVRTGSGGLFTWDKRDALYWVSRGTRKFTLKKLECSKQAFCSNTLAWNNEIGRLRFYFVGF